MILKRKNDLFYLQFPMLNRVAGLGHAIFLRGGGSSQGAFRELNISRRIGDDAGAVEKNRSRVAQVMGAKTLVFADQNHGTHVLDIGEAARDRRVANLSAGSGDAMVAKGAYHLVIQTADCQAILLVDSRKRIVANIHAGWRGSITNIIDRTIQVMITNHGCRPENIIAAVGPSLGPCCAEFVNYREEIPERLWGYKDASHHFNFWKVSRDQLQAAGVPSDRIELGQICTRCNPHLFYSYRCEAVTGRFANVIGFQPKLSDF